MLDRPEARDDASEWRSGRFVLLGATDGDWHYVTSWDTWAEAEAAFPIEAGFRLRDDETGRTWRSGSPYEWEAALDDLEAGLEFWHTRHD